MAFIWHLAQVTVPESDQPAGIEASSPPTSTLTSLRQTDLLHWVPLPLNYKQSLE